jgi:hypothetical protein
MVAINSNSVRPARSSQIDQEPQKEKPSRSQNGTENHGSRTGTIAGVRTAEAGRHADQCTVDS